MNQRYCINCEIIKPITDFYKTRVGANGNQLYQSSCKICANDKRCLAARRARAELPPNKNGFQKLPITKQDEIKKYLNTMNISRLANKVGVPTLKLHYWKRSGYIV